MGQDSARAAARDNEQINRVNNETQREFAQHGVRWKVEDARRAGLHPLAAIGAQTSSFSPVTAGIAPEDGAATAVASTGQNISRAISATSTAHEREIQQIQMASAKLDLEGKALDNQYRLAQLNNLSKGPSFPGSDNFMPGQGNSGLVKINPSERTVSAPGRPSQEAGWVPDVGYARTDTGLTPIPSKDVKERIEDQIVPEVMWAIRNQLTPNFSDVPVPPKSMLPKGAHSWKWNFMKQEWQPKYGGPTLGERVRHTMENYLERR